MKNSVVRLLITMLVVSVVSWSVFAQGGGSSSSLSGTVFDQSGAIVPGAEVVVINTDTGEQYKAITADNGTFFLPVLSIGTYTATVAVPGFKQAVVKDIRLTSGNPGTIRIKLEAGGGNEVD